MKCTECNIEMNCIRFDEHFKETEERWVCPQCEATADVLRVTPIKKIVRLEEVRKSYDFAKQIEKNCWWNFDIVSSAQQIQKWLEEEKAKLK